MIDLKYFSIGIGAETISTELKTLENDDKYKIKKGVLEHTLKMLGHCEAVFDINKMFKNSDLKLTYHKLILGDVEKYEPEKTSIKIRNIKSTIQNIQEGKKVSKKSTETAYEFFGDLAKKCINIMHSPDYGEGLKICGFAT